MNCETYLALECAPKPPWPTGFEKSKIHQPNPEELQFKGSKIEAFLLVFEENAENWVKMLQSCFLRFSISQDWVDGFSISQRLWVRETLGHILKLSRFHRSCKQNFYVTKSPKIHLFGQFHIWVTVATYLFYCVNILRKIIIDFQDNNDLSKQ